MFKIQLGNLREKQQTFHNSSVHFFQLQNKNKTKPNLIGMKMVWVFWQVERAKLYYSVCIILLDCPDISNSCLPVGFFEQSTNPSACKELRPCLARRCRNKTLEASRTKCLSERCSLGCETSRFFL